MTDAAAMREAAARDITLARCRSNPSEWRVEECNVDGEGACAVTIFCGQDAARRARRYAQILILSTPRPVTDAEVAAACQALDNGPFGSCSPHAVRAVLTAFLAERRAE